jgi:hypothetical protein
VRIFGSKEGKVKGGWRKLRYEEVHNFIKSRRMRCVIRVACMRKIRKVHKILIGKLEEEV